MGQTVVILGLLWLHLLVGAVLQVADEVKRCVGLGEGEGSPAPASHLVELPVRGAAGQRGGGGGGGGGGVQGGGLQEDGEPDPDLQEEEVYLQLPLHGGGDTGYWYW